MELVNICTNCQSIVTEKNHVEIFSYGTHVLSIKWDDEGYHTYTRHWNGWSMTTTKHINKALAWYGLPPINKAQWLAMPVVEG